MKHRSWIGFAVAWMLASAAVAGAHPPPSPPEPDPYLVNYPFVTTEEEGLAISDVVDGSLGHSRYSVADPTLGIVYWCDYPCWATEQVEFVGTDAHLSHLDQYSGQVTLRWQNWGISFFEEDARASVYLDLQVYCDSFSARPIELKGDQGFQSFPVTFLPSAEGAGASSGSGGPNSTEPAQPEDCETDVWGHDVSLSLTIVPSFELDPTAGVLGDETTVDFLTDGSSFVTVRSLPSDEPVDEPSEETPPGNETVDDNETVGGNETSSGNETLPDDEEPSDDGGNETDDGSGDGNETATSQSGQDDVPTLPGASAGLAIAGILGTLLVRRRNRIG